MKGPTLFRRVVMSIKCSSKVYFASLFIAFSAPPASAQAPDIRTVLSGHWVINDELSDNTDQVEEAIEAVAAREPGFFNRQEDFYRGGPPGKHDRISYDDVLTIEVDEPELLHL